MSTDMRLMSCYANRDVDVDCQWQRGRGVGEIKETVEDISQRAGTQFRNVLGAVGRGDIAPLDCVMTQVRGVAIWKSG